MVLHPPRRRATRPSPHDGSVTLPARPTDGGFTRSSTPGHRPARRPVDRPVRRPRRRAGQPAPAPRRQRLPVRATTRSRSSSTRPAAPDLCVIHSAAHNWEDQGGHLGEHGSLGVVQARAPFVIAGKGVRNARRSSRGGAPRRRRADDRRAARLRAARPTARYLAVQDGEVAHRRARRRRSARATSSAFLFDGTNPNVLYDMAARGEAPERRAPHRDGHRVRARRDVVAAHGHAREPHVDHHRRATRATTASSTTRGTTARPASR